MNNTTMASLLEPFNATTLLNVTHRVCPPNITYDSAPEMFKFNLRTKHLVLIYSYSVMFFFSFIGNVMLFLILVNNHRMKPDRVNKLLLNMNIADLLVTLFSLPKEILYNYSIVWNAPDWLCPTAKFIDALSVYLSSNVLIVITLDRFMCIMSPRYPAKAEKKIHVAIVMSWIVAIIASLPQIYLFAKLTHPCFPWWTLCNGRSLIRQVPPEHEFVATVFHAVMVYFLPLAVIIICYTAIVSVMMLDGTKTIENSIINEASYRQSFSESPSNASLASITGERRRSVRVSSKGFHLTAAMVVLFLVCWTPYFIAVVYHFISFDYKANKSTGTHIPDLVMTFLFIFANFNSVANPYIYAYFSNRLCDEIKGPLYCLTGRKYHRHSSAGRSSGRKQELEDPRLMAELIPLNIHDFKSTSHIGTLSTPMSPVTSHGNNSEEGNNAGFKLRDSSGSNWHMEI